MTYESILTHPVWQMSLILNVNSEKIMRYVYVMFTLI
jgi:hypothetical protein